VLCKLSQNEIDASVGRVDVSVQSVVKSQVEKVII